MKAPNLSEKSDQNPNKNLKNYWSITWVLVHMRRFIYNTIKYKEKKSQWLVWWDGVVYMYECIVFFIKTRRQGGGVEAGLRIRIRIRINLSCWICN